MLIFVIPKAMELYEITRQIMSKGFFITTTELSKGNGEVAYLNLQEIVRFSGAGDYVNVWLTNGENVKLDYSIIEFKELIEKSGAVFNSVLNQ